MNEKTIEPERAVATHLSNSIRGAYLLEQAVNAFYSQFGAADAEGNAGIFCGRQSLQNVDTMSPLPLGEG